MLVSSMYSKVHPESRELWGDEALIKRAPAVCISYRTVL